MAENPLMDMLGFDPKKLEELEKTANEVVTMINNNFIEINRKLDYIKLKLDKMEFDNATKRKLVD